MQWIRYLVLIAVIGLVIVAYGWFNKLYLELPDIKQLYNVQYQIPLSIYSKDEILLAQFGDKKRTPIKIDKIPQLLIQAFLATEDSGFYSHFGVDFKGIARATFQHLLTGEKRQGGSTITMQVARNFLLSKEKTYSRKIKEIILALQIERRYSKNKIMELYLNKIYLGQHSYGVSAAAHAYFGKTLLELDLAQIAMIAGLPKAPSANNPITNPKMALQRRNYVLNRMLKLNYIKQSEFDSAINQESTASLRYAKSKALVNAPFVAEMVRKKIVKQYADKSFTLGLKVYTTIVSSFQSSATRSLRSALYSYDYRHGYRSLPHANKIKFNPSEYSTIADIQSAQVLEIKLDFATAQLKNGSIIELPFKNIQWARKFKSRNLLGDKLKSITDILQPNDLIKVRQLEDKTWGLAQIPEVEAAFVAVNSNDGAILALSGGFDFFHNKFNRVTQAKRQPGSGFKPIIYLAALENNYTLASLVNDAPIVLDNPTEKNEWRPQNYSKKFFGMTSIRTALRKSRNLVSIRLLREIGIEKVTDTALRLGFTPKQLPNKLSLALGSGQATPLQMATLYAVFANGGFLIKPYFIDRIEDSKGNILFQASPDIVCVFCTDENIAKFGYAPRVVSPQINFLMNSLLRDVVKRGTATKAKVLGRSDLAGKTGTTNEQRDAWFNGFGAGIVATVWLGFDGAEPLGRYETGGKSALPMWIDFMRDVLPEESKEILEPIKGISKVYIDPKTGLLLKDDKNKAGIWEFFRTEHVPTEFSPSKKDTETQGEIEKILF